MTVPGLSFDHLVIGAATLEEGVAWAEARLGVTVPPGGRHPLMATHNRVTALGPSSFLEVIAVDPAAPAPTRARLFALDDPGMRDRLARGPRLIAWVAGTDDIAASLARADAAGAGLGRAIEMTRGDLVWRLSVPDDGHLPEAGILPALIQWRPGLHPATAMTDRGLRLEALELRHPEAARIAAALAAIGAERLATIVSADRPAIRAALRDAAGTRLALGDTDG